MDKDRPDSAANASDSANRRSLRHVRAAQLRTRALRWAVGKSALGSVFLIGALTYALAPQRHTEQSRIWMTLLLVLSTVNVGLGLRTFSRARSRVGRRTGRYWLIATALWGALATVLIRFLMQR